MASASKKKGPQDLTLRNLRAIKKRLAELPETESCSKCHCLIETKNRAAHKAWCEKVVRVNK